MTNFCGIKKIHILDASNQYESTIEKNKNRYLFQLVKVDISSSIDQTNKILTIYETNFQGLSVATPLQIELKEVPDWRIYKPEMLFKLLNDEQMKRLS